MGSADEFCKRGNSLKTYWKEMSDAMKREIPDRQKTFERTFTDVYFLHLKSGKFDILQKIVQLTSAWVILSQVAHVGAICISCAYGYWRVSVLLHNSLLAWANWLLIL